MILSNASEDTDCTDENVPGYIGEVIPKKRYTKSKGTVYGIHSTKKLYTTYRIIRNNTINNYNIILDKN